jgi:lipopolysaccharide transport system permease protein
MSTPILELDGSPQSRRALLTDLVRFRNLLVVLATTDFQVRYKRAVFGVLWAVVVPLVQAAIVAVVFSQVVRVAGSQRGYAVFVLSGVLAWSYFASALGAGATAVVDGSALTEKLWFPRALLPIVPGLSALVGLGISVLALVVALFIFGVTPTASLILLLPGCVLLAAFTTALSLVLSALHVYFRDVRYLVQALLVVWFYATPVLYPVDLLGRLRPYIELNPMTGIVGLFHASAYGWDSSLAGPVTLSVLVTIALIAVAVEVYRRHDRLFADLM